MTTLAERLAAAPPNIAAALVKALSTLTTVKKDQKANTGSYSYTFANIAGVVDETRPVLAANEIVALTPVHAHEDGLACTVVLLHSSGESIVFDPFPFPAGRDAQATGSMTTYHRRYALLSALGMATEDDDGAGAVARGPRQQEPADGPISEENADRLRQACEAEGFDAAVVVDKGTKGRTDDPALVLRSEIPAVREALKALVAEKAAA